jgi:hypothetical protein
MYIAIMSRGGAFGEIRTACVIFKRSLEANVDSAHLLWENGAVCFTEGERLALAADWFAVRWLIRCAA